MFDGFKTPGSHKLVSRKVVRQPRTASGAVYLRVECGSHSQMRV